MKRAVIQIGESTQLISLPRKWSVKYGIRKGDQLEVEEEGSELIVHSGKEVKLKSISIVIPKNRRFHRRQIEVLYRMGFDEIIVEFENVDIGNSISEEMNRLIGFEIVDQSSKKWVLHNVASAMETEFDTVLRRILLMMSTMSKDIVATLSQISSSPSSAYAQLSEIAQREKINNKLTMFCQRLLNKRGYHESYRITTLYLLLSLIEMTVDSLRDACEYIVSHKFKPNKNVITIFIELSDLISFFLEFFSKYESENFVIFKEKKDALWVDSLKLLGKDQHSANLAHYILLARTHLHHATETFVAQTVKPNMHRLESDN